MFIVLIYFDIMLNVVMLGTQEEKNRTTGWDNKNSLIFGRYFKSKKVQKEKFQASSHTFIK